MLKYVLLVSAIAGSMAVCHAHTNEYDRVLKLYQETGEPRLRLRLVDRLQEINAREPDPCRNLARDLHRVAIETDNSQVLDYDKLHELYKTLLSLEADPFAFQTGYAVRAAALKYLVRVLSAADLKNHLPSTSELSLLCDLIYFATQDMMFGSIGLDAQEKSLPFLALQAYVLGPGSKVSAEVRYEFFTALLAGLGTGGDQEFREYLIKRLERWHLMNKDRKVPIAAKYGTVLEMHVERMGIASSQQN